MRGQHGEIHKRFDAEEMGESARIYVDVALAHLSARAQRNLWKAVNFGRSYGMPGIRLYESLSHRVMESPHGY